MTKDIFLTLQRGEQIACLRLSPAPFALIAASLLCSLAFALRPEAPVDPQNFHQAIRRIAALQAELERATSQQALTADLLNGRMAQAHQRLARLEGQSVALADLGASRPAALRMRILEEALEQQDRQDLRRLTELTHQRQAEVTRVEKAMAQAGISLPVNPSSETALVGPFIPLAQHLSGPFAQKYEEALPIMARHAAWQAQLPHLPVRAPFAGAIEMTSGFGARVDPFHGRAAWHSGLDLRSDTGSDVFATAAGTITASGWNGAYGLSLDIDHGNGLSTRYAHLSRIFMREGDRVEAGERIALSGASGRTKGAHLHYETRLEGEAINPQRLMKAGEALGLLPKTVSRDREAAQ